DNWLSAMFPVTLAAVVALVALVALPVRLPTNAPAMTLLALVAIVTPARLFVPLKKLVPLSSATLADNWLSVMFPVTLAAVVALVALVALPVRLPTNAPAMTLFVL